VPFPQEKPTDAGQEGFEISDPVTRRVRRRMFRRLPWGAVRGHAPICCDSNDPRTVIKGVEQRLMREVPTPDARLLAEFTAFCRMKFQKWFGALGSTLPMEFEDWLESCKGYNLNRKAQLREAYADNRGGPPELHYAQKVKSFVKTESYQAYKYCRMICSRKDRFKAFFGPAMKAVEAVLYKRKEFIKHVPVPERPAAIASLQQSGRRYYISDYTAFESHFTARIQRACELQALDVLLDRWVHTAYVKKVLTGENKCRVAADWLRFQLKAKRMSGEMSTSGFNGIANLMVLKFIVWKKGGKVSCYVEGDDAIFSTTVPIVPQDYLDLGFTCKLVEVESPLLPLPTDRSIDPESVAFCGIACSQDYQLMRSPRRFLQTFGWTSSFITAGESIMNQLLRAGALSACYETPQCPIISVIAREALRRTRGVRIEERIRHLDQFAFHEVPSDETPIQEFDPSPSTRHCFSVMYGIDEQQQLVIEDAIRKGDLEMVAKLIPPRGDVEHYAARYVVVA